MQIFIIILNQEFNEFMNLHKVMISNLYNYEIVYNFLTLIFNIYIKLPNESIFIF
jgi:hypothetical protein